MYYFYYVSVYVYLFKNTIIFFYTQLFITLYFIILFYYTFASDVVSKYR